MDLMKTGGGPGVLSSLPSTLYRWTEECRVLDGSSVHDIITGIVLLILMLISTLLYSQNQNKCIFCSTLTCSWELSSLLLFCIE